LLLVDVAIHCHILKFVVFEHNIILHSSNQGGAKHIKIHEDSNGSIYTTNVETKQVTSAKEVMIRLTLKYSHLSAGLYQ
jgi:hypothetical protein